MRVMAWMLRATTAGCRRCPRGCASLGCVLLALACALLGLPSAAAAADELVGEPGFGAGQLEGPSGVAVDQATGEVFVVEDLARRVSVFTATGEFLRAFGWGVIDGAAKLEVCTAGTGCQRGLGGGEPGELGGKVGGMKIAVDQASGEVYVTDPENFRVQEFTAAGAWVAMFGREVNATTRGDVCTATNVQEGDSCGAGQPGSEPAALGNLLPEGKPLAYEGVADQIWVVAGEDGELIKKFTPAGVFSSELGPLGLAEILLLAPAGAGDFFAAEGKGSTAQEIYKYDGSSGRLCAVADQFAGKDTSVRHLAMVGDIAAGELIVNDEADVGGMTSTALLKFNENCEETRQWDHHQAKVEEINAQGLAVNEATGRIYAVGGNVGPGHGMRIVGPPASGPEPGGVDCQDALASGVSVSGQVDPEGNQSEYWFEYVDAKGFEERGFIGAPRTPTGSLPADFGEHEVNAKLSGLAASTTYHVRLTAKNSEGQDSTESVCATAPVAQLSLLPVEEPAGTTATLAGYVNPDGLSTTARFEYWANGTPIAEAEPTTVGPEGGWAPVSVRLDGLAPATTYHDRLVAKNSAGTVSSSEQSFTTPGGVCANEDARSGASAKLAECRAYEQVTPVNKAGVPPVGPIDIEPTGERLAYYSKLPFPGSASGAFGEYVASRGATGWSSQSAMPAMTGPAPEGLATSPPYIRLMSSDLSREAIETSYPFSLEAQGRHQAGETGGEGPPGQVYLGDGSEPPQWLSAPLTRPDVYPYNSTVVGATPDLAHVLISTAKPLVPAANGSTTENLYEWSEGHLELINVNDAGALMPGGASAGGAPKPDPQQAEQGRPILGAADFPSAISNDGRIVYFTSQGQLYVRHEGQTSEVSLSQRAGSVGVPAEAQFLAASRDGKHVLFYSHSQLTDDATAGGAFYEYSLESGALSFAGAASELKFTGNREVIGATPDLSYVYVWAQGSVTPPNDIYMLHDGAVVHVAHLELSELSEAGYSSEPQQASMSPNGQYLAFLNGARIGGYENDGAGEIYEYDAATGVTSCVSCRPGGGAPVDVSANRMEPYKQGPYATERTQLHVVTSSGAVFFDSTEALVSRDKNDQEDVYEYNNGQLALISSGTSSRPSAIFGIADEGRDAFILTSQSLTRTDTDGGLADVYDARVGGGFPPQAETPACTEPDCRPATTSGPEPLLVTPASSIFSGLGNLPPAKPAGAKNKAKHGKARKHTGGRRHRRHARHQRYRRHARHRNARHARSVSGRSPRR